MKRLRPGCRLLLTNQIGAGYNFGGHGLGRRLYMADQIGIVLQTGPGGWAQVSTDRKGACAGCESHPSECSGCLAGAQKMESRAANPVGARAGDLVKVHIDSKNIFTGAAILYLVPVLGLLIGVFTGAWAAQGFGWSAIFGGLMGTLTGLAAGFGVVIAIDRSAGIRRKMTPTITAVIAVENQAVGKGHASCCG
jgi:sigma-E factor negative regulatory protein RseC